MKQNQLLPLQRYKVMVRCHTYNHGKYICDALNGFVMQKTNFPFCVLIFDDCSTDNEQQVIEKYICSNCEIDQNNFVNNELMIAYTAVPKNNKNCTLVLFLLKSNHYQRGVKMLPYYQPWRDYSEYEALCEGDDYWIDSLKLQKQVDFMDCHPDYGMIHTDFDLTTGPRNHSRAIVYEDGVCFPYILTKGMDVGSLTVLYRLSIFENLPHFYLNKNWPMADKPMWIELAQAAKIHYLRDITSCYRVLDDSASHSKDVQKLIDFKYAGLEIVRFYADYYGVILENDGFDYSFYERIVRFACRTNCYKEAHKYYLEAKSKGLVNWRCRLFYYGAKYPIIKKIFELYIKA